jgi:uncharacterized membrane protein
MLLAPQSASFTAEEQLCLHVAIAGIRHAPWAWANTAFLHATGSGVSLHVLVYRSAVYRAGCTAVLACVWRTLLAHVRPCLLTS